MKQSIRGSILSFVLGVAGLTCNWAFAQPEFTVTDITSWNDTQLAALPFFQRFVPVDPSTAPTNSYVARAHNVSGQVAGDSDSTYGRIASLSTDTTVDVISSYGTYHWQYTYWDGEDLHFVNGKVDFTHAYDVNAAGLTIGDSTLYGTGSNSGGYTAHAILYDPTTDTKTDLTPAYEKAAAKAINNDALIAGWVNDGSGQRAFLRYPNGVFHTLDTFYGSAAANAINPNGAVVGSSRAQGGTLGRDHAFVNEEGTAITDPGLFGEFDSASAYDVNSALWVVGAMWRYDQSYEHFAAFWQKVTGGWEAYDLNELIDADYLLEKAIAVNEEGYIIARGRPDGSDVYGSGLYLLTPNEFAVPVDSPRDIPPVVGDANGDGVVDFVDVTPFLQALFDRPQYEIDFPGIDADIVLDINSDGVQDFVDVTPFLGILFP